MAFPALLVSPALLVQVAFRGLAATPPFLGMLDEHRLSAFTPKVVLPLLLGTLATLVTPATVALLANPAIDPVAVNTGFTSNTGNPNIANVGGPRSDSSITTPGGNTGVPTITGPATNPGQTRHAGSTSHVGFPDTAGHPTIDQLPSPTSVTTIPTLTTVSRSPTLPSLRTFVGLTGHSR